LRYTIFEGEGEEIYRPTLFHVRLSSPTNPKNFKTAQSMNGFKFMC